VVAGGVDLNSTNGKAYLERMEKLSNVRYVGVVRDSLSKARLLWEATVLVQPSQYLEPCGFNVIEAHLCGCPTVVPAHGAFPDHVQDGENGFLDTNVLKEGQPWFLSTWFWLMERCERGHVNRPTWSADIRSAARARFCDAAWHRKELTRILLETCDIAIDEYARGTNSNTAGSDTTTIKSGRISATYHQQKRLVLDQPSKREAKRQRKLLYLGGARK
jgi:glycosyltransferase involved in cell wall biosynthesis